jgi:Tfp pilus assembly protein PilX
MRPTDHRPRGSVTLVALCFTTVLAIVLSSYLMLCYNSYRLSTRLLHEDKARQLAYAGLEEALWSLNQGNWSSSGPANTNSWAISGANRTATLAYPALGQGATGQLALTVTNYASTGPATWPGITSTATITLGDGRVVTKTLQATTTTAPLFANALASENSYVSFVTGGTVDSWNSDPDNNPATPAVAYSFTAGNAANYAAVVAGNDNGTNGVLLNQALIYGYVATFGKPVTYSTSGTPPGKLKGPATAAAVNVDPTRLGYSAFVPASSVFTVTAPPLVAGSFDLLSLLSIIITISPANSGIYSAPSGFSLPAGLLGYTLYVDRPVQMVVNGNFTIGSGLFGPAQIVVRPPDGELEIFVTGNGDIGGNGIQNQTKDPSKVSIFFTNSSTVTPVNYTTGADFYGVIYSVNKPIDIRQNANFYGALLSGQYVRFSTSATAPVFHYDTALRTKRFKNVTTPFIIDQLTEP